MVAEAAAAGQFEEPGFAPVPRIQIVTIEEAMRLRDRAVQLPARRDDAFKRAAREEAPERQGELDLVSGAHAGFTFQVRHRGWQRRPRSGCGSRGIFEAWR